MFQPNNSHTQFGAWDSDLHCMPRSHRQWSHLVDVMSMYMRPWVLHKRAGRSLVEVESGVKPERSINTCSRGGMSHSAMIDLQRSTFGSSSLQVGTLVFAVRPDMSNFQSPHVITRKYTVYSSSDGRSLDTWT